MTYLTANGSLRRRVWRPFDEARAFVHTLGLRNQIEWRHWAKTPAKPYDIPADPYTYYKRRGWVSWGDWLGTGRVHRGSYRPFVEVRAFARSLGLRSLQEWTAWARTPA